MDDLLAWTGQRFPFLLPAFAFVFGAVVGSFLNVVIARVPAGESIVSPRSRCPRCKNQLAWFENLPLVSWLVLRARCRHCGQPISARYPMVELIAAFLALAVETRFGFGPAALGYFAFSAALLALAYIDLDTWLLPHEITWPLIAVGLASPLWNRALPFAESAAGAGVGFAVFAAVALLGEKLLRREAMGWGDVWLLSGIGAWLGVKALLPVVLLSSLQGAVVGVALLALGRDPARRRRTTDEAAPPPTPADESAHLAVLDEDGWVPPRHAVPFGPFLALAALEVLLIGPALFAAWDSLLSRFLG
jgi:leader peptidase (prepilin peptidase)/N-methyltransferase